MAEEQKFPTEVIDLPSEGKLYPKDSPLSSGKIEIKYMTAKEEDILTSQNLIEKGIVIDKLLQALIIDKNINLDDLVSGDKDAIMIAARILAYGPEYTVNVNNPTNNSEIRHTFDLTHCPFKKLPENIDKNEFELELPISKYKIKFKLLTGHEEKLITEELKGYSKLGYDYLPELSTRLKAAIISVQGDDTKLSISQFIENLLSRDSFYLRSEINKLSPGVDLKQEIEIGGTMVMVDIPLTISFFWPTSEL
jgi:hypothetical protein